MKLKEIAFNRHMRLNITKEGQIVLQLYPIKIDIIV